MNFVVKTEFDFGESLISPQDLYDFVLNNNLEFVIVGDSNLFALEKLLSLFKNSKVKLIMALHKDSKLYIAKNNQGLKSLFKLHSENILEQENLIIVEVREENFVRVLYTNQLEELKIFNQLFAKKYYPTAVMDIAIYQHPHLIKLAQVIDIYSLYQNKFQTIFTNKYQVPNNLYLYKLAHKGLEKRGLNLKDNYLKQLDYELSIVQQLNLADYFLIVHDLVLNLGKRNINIGLGRGSAPSSLLVYCLGISEIDPIRYQLSFARFLNLKRGNLPDIDLDLPSNKRMIAIEYLKEKYGNDHVFSTTVFARYRLKNALIDLIKLDSDFDQKMAKTLLRIADDYNKVDDFIQDSRLEILLHHAKVKNICNLLIKLEDKIKHFSCHPSSIVISKEKIEQISSYHLYQDLKVSDLEYQKIEELGLIKLDLLSLNYLNIINDLANKLTINIKQINFDDQNLFKILHNGLFLSLFQLESKNMQNLILRAKPKNDIELANIIALYRPGPMNYLDKYLNNLSKKSKTYYHHPIINQIVEETHGIILFQEQIIAILRNFVHLDEQEADIYRRAISKKDEYILKELKTKFYSNAQKYNQVNLEFVDKLYHDILEFAKYGFNKAHAISYSHIILQLCHLKYYYPLDFYSYIANIYHKDEIKYQQFRQEIKFFNLQFEAVNLKNSTASFYVRNNKIIESLTVVKGIDNNTARALTDERITTYYQFVARVQQLNLNQQQIDNLIDSGSLDYLKYSRNSLKANFINFSRYYQLNDLSIPMPKMLICQDKIIENLIAEYQVLSTYRNYTKFKNWSQNFKLAINFTDDINYQILALVVKSISKKSKNNKPYQIIKVFDGLVTKDFFYFEEAVVKDFNFYQITINNKARNPQIRNLKQVI